MYEYRIGRYRINLMHGHEEMQDDMNAMAKNGWRVISVVCTPQDGGFPIDYTVIYEIKK